jgi:hypothetical protein
LYITAGVGLATVIVTMPALIAAGQNIEVQQQGRPLKSYQPVNRFFVLVTAAKTLLFSLLSGSKIG